MVLIQSPKKKMESLLNFIKQNIVAYQKAIDAIKKPLDKLLTDFPNGNYMSKNILKDVNPTPILIYPAIEIVTHVLLMWVCLQKMYINILRK